MPAWLNTTFRRASVDMHIPDWDPVFLSRFDAEAFADQLKKGHAQSHLQMCNSHSGQAMWQSRIAPVHRIMQQKKRDYVLELATACRKRDIRFIAYMSLSFDCQTYENHPEWRCVSVPIVRPGYYKVGLCCFNAPGYRDYLLGCIDELAGGTYPIDGMFFDMPFWGVVCYCHHCAARFKKEEGQDPPLEVNWDDPLWKKWQAMRERSILDLVKACSERVKSHNPHYSASFNHSTVLGEWIQGSCLEISRYNDYQTGDWYGEPFVHSLACKVLKSLAKNPVVELATSRTSGFWEHATFKSFPVMRQEAFIASLNSAALLLIDYVNIDGTLNPPVYDVISRLNKERIPFESFLGGTPKADVALYLDKNSLYDPTIRGDIRQMNHETLLYEESPHREAFIGMAKILQQRHIPFGVVTNITLDQLEKYSVVLLPDVLEISQEQAEIFRSFVKRGGKLYASGYASLDRVAQTYRLADVFGVDYKGQIGNEKINYVFPASELVGKAIHPQEMLAFEKRTMMRGDAHPDAEVLAWVGLPFVDPAKVYTPIGPPFAAFHSHPPALSPTDAPALIRHRYGKGEAIWSAAPLERSGNFANHELFSAIFEEFLPKRAWRLEAIPDVEMMLHEQANQNRLTVSLINYARPPASAASGRVNLSMENPIAAVRRVPDMQSIPFTQTGGTVEFCFEGLECFQLYVIELKAS